MVKNLETYPGKDQFEKYTLNLHDTRASCSLFRTNQYSRIEYTVEHVDCIFYSGILMRPKIPNSGAVAAVMCQLMATFPGTPPFKNEVLMPPVENTQAFMQIPNRQELSAAP